MICIIFILMFSFSFADLIRPDSGANLTYIYVPFEWEQEADVINYNLQISTQESFNTLIVDILEPTTAYIEKQNLDWDDTYYWRVKSIYDSEDFGEWSEISTFIIEDKQFPDIDASIYNEDLLQDGLVAFGGFAPNLASAVIDKYGNEIWNSGEPGSFDFILNHINESGNMYGLSVYDYPYHTGTKINYDIDFLWSTQGDLNSDGEIDLEGNEDAIDIHEFKQIPNGNYMAFVPDYQLGPIPQGDWSFIYQALGYQADGVTEEYPWIGMRIVEWDEYGNEVWNWDPFEHFTMDDTDLYGGIWWDFNAGRHDWMHSNAFHFDEEESVIYVSHRHLSRISKIAYPSGDVIWNIGMPEQYNTGSDNICTDLGNSFQHNIQLMDDGSLLFFDNGNLSQMLMGDSNPTSRIRRIRVIDNSYCETEWEYELPPNLFGLGMGSVQLLNNGNYLMYTFGSGLNQGEPTLREITPDYEVVWNYQGTNNSAWYRTYKIPSLHPDIFSVIANNYTINEDNMNIIQMDNSLINFTVYNKTGYTQHYTYSFGDSEDGLNPMFSYENGEIVIPPYENISLSFPMSDMTISSTSIGLSIWPTYHDYAMKELSFYVIANNSVLGDINQDGLVNVLDIVSLINIILDETSNNEFSDINEDGVINVLDIVLLVNIILEP